MINKMFNNSVEIIRYVKLEIKEFEFWRKHFSNFELGKNFRRIVAKFTERLIVDD